MPTRRRRSSPLIEVPLAQLLGASSIATLEKAVLALRESKDRDTRDVKGVGPKETLARSLLWKLPAGEQFIPTDIKILPSSAAQLMVMLTFWPVKSTVTSVMNQLPFDLLILDTDLKVTYANAAAMRSGAAIPGGVLGCSALALGPTAVIHPEVYASALEGRTFRDEAVAYTEPGKADTLVRDHGAAPAKWREHRGSDGAVHRQYRTAQKLAGSGGL